MTSKSKFETLIEYVINDDEQKARELFHDIVVEKSREIYENLMDEDEAEEVDESAESDEEVTEDFGGDASDDLIDDVETEEQGISMEDEEEFGDEPADEFGGDEMPADEFGGEEMPADGEGDIEGRVVDLEDKLDELMAEFEAMMGGDEEMPADDGMGDEFADAGVEGGDEFATDDTEEFAEQGFSLEENVSLKAAPKPVTTQAAGVNTKSTVPANSGARGALASPVKPTGTEAQGRPAPKAQDMSNGSGRYGTPGAAPKPTTAQASGVNTRSPVSKA